MNLNLVSLFVAFAVTFILTPVVRRVAIRLEILDHPDKRKMHNNDMPLLGSIAVYLGFLAGLFLSGFHPFLDKELFILLSAATLLLVVGVLDDGGFLHPQVKLMGAMPVAGLILIYFDLGLNLFPLRFFNYFFTLLWVVGITAAYNLLDGMDGLSTGVCLIASIFYLAFGVITGDFLLIWIASSLAGACLAFLIFNFHPAKIFLGDSGAILLGFLLASMGLRVANHESLPLLTRWMIPILILAVPIFDTSLITFSRVRRGLVPFLHPGKDHSHHRLFNLGLGQRKTVFLIYLLGTTGGVLSLFISRLTTFWGYMLFGLLILFGLILLSLFENLPYDRQELMKKEARG
ncbi:MAG: undecaprenyl/decaprenyl-phosphate alpha-N-acetylglucosaminyl 1-phosphate transferase [Deltaproteobacteria bacterium]|nr:undecaprenyl/decaprenyl-phosphate alpha-N-acetylglucosaminyl 1-phosphate transferase [Deltaproteobacteria bacterium]